MIYFRGLTPAAPLKQTHVLDVLFVEFVFPRANTRGPIEALINHSFHLYPFDFRGLTPAAPLKLNQIVVLARGGADFRGLTPAAPLKQYE